MAMWTAPVAGAAPATRKRRTRRGFAAVAVLVMLGGLLSACDSGAVLLTGSITVEPSHSLASGAEVEVYSDSSETLVATIAANPLGEYTIQSSRLPEGAYRLRVGGTWYSSVGFATYWVDAETVHLTSSETTRLDFEVGSVASVEGRLVAADKTSFEGGWIVAQRVSDGSIVGVATSGADGTFELGLEDAGDVTLVVLADGVQPVGGDEPTVYSPTESGVDIQTIDVTTGLPITPMFTDVTAGGKYSCGLSAFDASAHCWGPVGSLAPPVADWSGPFLAVTAGYDFACGIRADQSSVCWGADNSDGQLLPPADGLRAIDAGYSAVCGVVPDGSSITCWGDTEYFGTTTLDAPAGQEFVSVATGQEHMCGLTDTGQVLCGGNDDYDQHLSIPSGATAISAGGYSTCAIDADQHIVCSGWDQGGNTEPPAGTYTSISSSGDLDGNDHSCAISTSGSLTCWGTNVAGEATPPTGTFLSVSTGVTHTCAITPDQFVQCFGDDTGGKLGPPTTW